VIPAIGDGHELPTRFVIPAGGAPGPLALIAPPASRACELRATAGVRATIGTCFRCDWAGHRHSRAENAEDFAASLSSALGHAHAYWASIQTNPELGARALDSAVSRCDSEAVVGKVTMTVDLPNTASLTVTLDQLPYAEPGGGFTTVAADSPLLATGIDGRDHLEIRSALERIGEVLTRYLADDAFDD
jgi:hypothetical protein